MFGFYVFSFKWTQDRDGFKICLYNQALIRALIGYQIMNIPRILFIKWYFVAASCKNIYPQFSLIVHHLRFMNEIFKWFAFKSTHRFHLLKSSFWLFNYFSSFVCLSNSGYSIMLYNQPLVLDDIPTVID